MASTQQARSAAEALVGPLEVVTDLSWPHEGSVVLDVVLADGTKAIVKQHRLARKLAAELHAYRSWVPAIADRAPTLLASGGDVLVLSRIDGDPAPKLEPDLHRQGGALLRRYQAAEAAQPDDGWAERQLEHLERWISRAPAGLLSDEEVAFTRSAAAALRDLPPLHLVPCHGDYQARNWVVDRGGQVHVIDFERSGPGWWVHDLGRLWWREWLDRPHLRDAFLEGYGKDLDDVEVAAIEALGTLGHVTTIVWATSVGDDEFAAEGRARLDQARGIA